MLNPRQKHRKTLPVVLYFLCSTGNGVQIVALLSEEENLFSALLLVTKFEVQKITFIKQAHNIHTKPKGKTNKQTKTADTVFQYQQLYCCVGTTHLRHLLKLQSDNSNSLQK